MAAEKTGAVPGILRELPRAPRPLEFEQMNDRQRLWAVGSCLLYFERAWPALVDHLEREHKAVAEVTSISQQAYSEARDSRQFAQEACEAVLRLERRLFGDSPMPPVRRPSASSHDVEDDLRRRMSDSFERLARTSEGPQHVVTATPKQLMDVVKVQVDEVLRRREDEIRNKTNAEFVARIEEERKRVAEAKAKAESDAKARTEAAEAEAEKAKGQLKRFLLYKLPILVITLLLGIAGAWAKAHSQGHDEGVAEERTRAKHAERSEVPQVDLAALPVVSSSAPMPAAAAPPPSRTH
jgi:hypothetical protein